MQSLVLVMYLLTAVGYFPQLAATSLQAYPHLFCVLTSLHPLFLLIKLYLLYLAIFGLVKEIKMEVFLNLDHEATVKRLNIASGIIVSLMMLADLWRIGTICNPKLATLFIKFRIGIEVDFDIPTKDLPTAFPLSLILISITTICCSFSFIMKRFKDNNKNKTKNKYAVGPERLIYSSQILPLTISQVSRSANQEIISMKELQSTSTITPVVMESHFKSTPIPTLTHVNQPQDSSSVKKEKMSTELSESTSTKFTAAAKLDDSQNKCEVAVKPSTLSEQAEQFQTMPEPNSTALDGNLPKRSFTRRSPIVEIDVLQMPKPAESVVQISPPAQVAPLTTPPTPQTPKENTTEKMLTELAVFLWGAILLATMVFNTTDTKSYILQTILSKLFKIMIECMPMYCVLMIDECSSISLRRSKTWLADNFQIYLD